MSLSQPTGVEVGAGVTGGRGKPEPSLAVSGEGPPAPPDLLAGIHRPEPGSRGVQGRQKSCRWERRGRQGQGRGARQAGSPAERPPGESRKQGVPAW